MNLKEMIEQLCGELDLDPPKLDAEKNYPLSINLQDTIFFREIAPGFSLHAKMSVCPEKKREDLFIYLMRANYLGQGTGGARIGLDAEEKFLTLSLGFPYEMNYQAFKESVEDFINYSIYWREEVDKFERET